MDLRDVEGLIIELLADDAGKDPAELRRELEDAGELMPVDSVVAAAVLARVEEACGVSLPATAESARNLASVTLFAQAILDLVHEKSGGRADSA